MFKKENKAEIIKIEKGKTYSYEEIEKIFMSAQVRVMENLDKRANEISKDSKASMMFFMQNMLITANLHSEMFERE